MTTSSEKHFPRTMRRVRNFLAGLFGAALTSTAPVGLAQTAPNGGIPQPWISYARLASGQFQAWLSDGSSDAVQRLHQRMQDRLLKADPNLPPPAVIVRVWVAQDGHVEKVTFDTLGDQTADADLRSILTSQSLSEAPPKDMKQPMVLKLDLDYQS